jgi:hypothetical protein
MKKPQTPVETADEDSKPAEKRSPAFSVPMADTIKSPPGSRLKKR